MGGFWWNSYCPSEDVSIGGKFGTLSMDISGLTLHAIMHLLQAIDGIP